MKPKLYGWLCLCLLLAVAFLIGLSAKERLAAEHSVLSGPSQHSLDVAAKTSLQESRVRVVKSYFGLPLNFEANRGQTDAQVKFLSRGPGYTLFLTRRGDAVLALRPSDRGDRREAVERDTAFKDLESRAARRAAVVRMHVVGGNARPEVEGVGELPGKANYFIGKDPTKWRRKVPLFSKVIYRHVYRGVDLVYYGRQRELEHDFVVAPGSDPHFITLRFDHEPAAVQMYVTGDAHSADFPTTPGAFQSTKPGGSSSNAFVTAINSDGSGLIYSTYLGGSRLEESHGIALDSAGNAYVTGFTASRDFPTTPDAFQTSILPNRVGTIGFVTALNSDGSGLIYPTYLGGSDHDQSLGIAVDAAGNAFVTGFTASSDFPTTPDAFQSANAGGLNAFVTALDSHGSGLIYSTYLGGSGHDQGRGLAVDAAGNAYVAGDTNSPDFPTTPNAFQPAYPGGRPDGFVAKN